MVAFRFHQYQVVGRGLPTEAEEHPKIYRTFLRKLKKVKKSNGQVLAINEIFEKNPTKIKMRWRLDKGLEPFRLITYPIRLSEQINLNTFCNTTLWCYEDFVV
ncbi:hypothetical protein PTKIN_Ptkin15bG0175200 [Pterospermum kingtungense]